MPPSNFKAYFLLFKLPNIATHKNSAKENTLG